LEHGCYGAQPATEKTKTFSTTKGTKLHEIKPNAVDFIFLRKNHTPREGVRPQALKQTAYSLTEPRGTRGGELKQPILEFAVNFIFLRKIYSPQKGVQAAGAKTNSHFLPRSAQITQRKNLQQIAAHRAIIC
jgi:hypothetical protein